MKMSNIHNDQQDFFGGEKATEIMKFSNLSEVEGWEQT
jgi:hypothetical protein